MHGTLTVVVIGAKGLAQKNMGGSSDPFCVVRFERQEVVTKVIPKTINPKWNASFSFDVTRADTDLNFRLYNRERFIKDEFLGMITVNIEPVILGTGEVHHKYFPLQSKANRKGKISGELGITLSFEPLEKKVCIDDFELLTVIGKGGFGKVVQVRKRDTQRIYAMKIIRKDTVVKKNKVRHTKAEKDLLQHLHHPFIVGMKYAFQSEDKLYLVLDYVNGGELFYHLKKNLRFTEEMVRFYAAEIVLALDYLHNHGIIYRDLKPENILIDHEGHVVLCDFGLVKTGLGYQNNSTTSTFCGTPEYLAPEMLLGKPYGTAVDWWSLGTLMFEMMTGLPPFYSENVKVMYDHILHSPLTFPKFLSSRSISLLRGLLCRDPVRRLGGGEMGAKEIKEHPFFDSIDWNLLYTKQLAPVEKPEVMGGDLDVSNIDSEFTVMAPVDSPVPFEKKVADVPNDAFLGFSYNHEAADNPILKQRYRRPSWAKTPPSHHSHITFRSSSPREPMFRSKSPGHLPNHGQPRGTHSPLFKDGGGSGSDKEKDKSAKWKNTIPEEEDSEIFASDDTRSYDLPQPVYRSKGQSKSPSHQNYQNHHNDMMSSSSGRIETHARPKSPLGKSVSSPNIGGRAPSPGLPEPVRMTPRKVKASPTKKLIRRVRSFNVKKDKPSDGWTSPPKSNMGKSQSSYSLGVNKK